MHFYEDGDEEFVRQIQLWLYFLITGVESENESLDATLKLKTYMNEAKKITNISKVCLQFTQGFFTTSFANQLYRMSQHHYMGCWSGWVSETSWVESSNKSLQYSAMAPKITDPLHRAGDKILQHTYETHRRRQTEAVAMSLKSLPSPAGQASRADQCDVALSRHIIPEIRERAFAERRLSQNYKCTLASNGKQTGDEKQLVFFLEYSLPPSTKTNHCHPIYRRTRTVTVSNVILAGESHLCYQCSCRNLHLRKFCCRHIYRLLSREPCKSDFLPECYKSYEVKYGVDMVYTGKVNQLQNIVKQCNGICMPGSINKWDLTGLNMEADATSFTSTPHQSVDVNPNSTTALDGMDTSTLFPNTSGQMLNIKMSAGALSKLQSYPVFNMATEQVKDKAGADILLKGVYKIFEDIVRHNNKRKNSDTRSNSVHRQCHYIVNHVQTQETSWLTIKCINKSSFGS